MKIGFGMNGVQRWWRNVEREKNASSGQQARFIILGVDHITLRSDGIIPEVPNIYKEYMFGLGCMRLVLSSCVNPN